MASKRTRRAKHRTKPTTTAAQRRRGRSYATARSVVNSAEREPIELKDHEVEEGLATGEHSGLLEDYFGSAQYSELRNLAQEAAVRGKRGGDRVLILPGIMGSKLGYRGSLLFDDVIWANPVAIAFGRLSELRLGAKRNGVDALGVLQFAYLKLKLKLQIAGHDAEFFPYDWRTSLSQIGKKLANEIKSGRLDALSCWARPTSVRSRRSKPSEAPIRSCKRSTSSTPIIRQPIWQTYLGRSLVYAK